MNDNTSTRKMRGIPLRVRLTLWYLFVLSAALALFGVYQYFQFKRVLLVSVDTSLELAVTQALPNVDWDNGGLAFQNTENWTLASRTLIQSDFAIRIVSPSSEVLDIIDAGVIDYSDNILPISAGFETVRSNQDQILRIYNSPINNSEGIMVGWLQSIRSLDIIYEVLDNMRLNLVIGLVLMLIFAGSGGFFLADRALRPMNSITHTAQSIGSSDLSKRIRYQGPDDEIGRLARTFNQMLARLQSAFEREQRFTGDAAHELRTPLTVIKGQIEVALSHPRSPKSYSDTLQRVLAQVDRLVRLSNSLLFLLRSDRQGLLWEPSSVNLSELLSVLVMQIHPLTEEKSLTFSADLSDSVMVFGDGDHLIRLFLNLLDNAVIHTPPDGEIFLKLEKQLMGARVTLHNSGSGISDKHLPHIFDRFYRVDFDRSSETGGAGLGLAIAYEIVHLHEGEIQVESQPGQGVTFIVDLPSESLK